MADAQRVIDRSVRALGRAVSGEAVVPSVQLDHDVTISREVYNTVTVMMMRKERGSMMDNGANNGIAGYECRILRIYPWKVNVSGIDNHQMSHLDIVDCSAKTLTNEGWVIIIMHYYAHHATYPTIHSVGQIEYGGNKVYDRSRVLGGKQCIITSTGHYIPLDFIHGLPYMQMYAHTDDEWETLPHIHLTGPNQWDPDVLDYNLSSCQRINKYRASKRVSTQLSGKQSTL
jgi:hypothetical protein